MTKEEIVSALQSLEADDYITFCDVAEAVLNCESPALNQNGMDAVKGVGLMGDNEELPTMLLEQPDEFVAQTGSDFYTL